MDAAEKSPPDKGRRPTLKTIAFMTGLGVTTVSRALKDAPDISEATKERVRLVAREIGYQPNRAGVRLRTGKTNVISLVFDLAEDHMGLTEKMVLGISEVLASTPYTLTITPYQHPTDPMIPIRHVLDTGSADGIIISRTEPDDARVRFLSEAKFPFATHGRTEMGIEHPYHDFDNEAFAYKGVQKLASLGRRRIAHLAPPADLTFGIHARTGFNRAIADFNLEKVPFGVVNIDASWDEIRTATQALMQQTNPPDGILSLSGAGAAAAIVGLESLGFQLGREIDMVTKEYTPLMRSFRPGMVAVHEDIRMSGRDLARAVLAQIEGTDVSGLQTLLQPPDF